MEIIDYPVDDIIKYQNNPRFNENAIEKVMISIKEYGFTQPIVLDKNNVILAGHTRFEASLRIGLSHVPVFFAKNLNDAQSKAYRIADNKSAEYSEWDMGLLSEELLQLKKMEFDLDKTLIDEEEIASLLANIDLFDNEEKEETNLIKKDIPKLVDLGDVWEVGDHILVCDDMITSEKLREITIINKPTLMVTDPPYGVNYDASWRNEARKNKNINDTFGIVLNDHKCEWPEIFDVFSGNVAYIWFATAKITEVKKVIENSDFEVKNLIIWNKNHFALGRGNYHSKFESCFYCVRNGCKTNWQKRRDQADLWDIKQINHIKDEERVPHDTQKPLQCMMKPILNNSSMGDYIFDPFLGSGTTLIACEKTGRKCIGCELNPEFCDIIIYRWQKETGKIANRIIENDK